jgi:hypothetical protein
VQIAVPDISRVEGSGTLGPAIGTCVGVLRAQPIPVVQRPLRASPTFPSPKVTAPRQRGRGFSSFGSLVAGLETSVSGVEKNRDERI